MGVRVIAITSSHYTCEKSRHSSEKHLADVSNLAIDSLVEKGDATLVLENTSFKVGPSSTLAAVFIINIIMVQTIENLMKQGVEVPVFVSNNISGGEAHNHDHLAKYKARLKHL